VRCGSRGRRRAERLYDSRRLLALRDKIASDYPYLEGKPERVIVTAGSQEALYLALLTLVDEGDEVLLPNPGFAAYPTIARMAGAFQLL
jgi:aspartate/methionine/tyrosine aminotransferase